MATVTTSIPPPMLCVPRQNAHALRTLGKRPTSTDRCLSIRRTNTRHALSCLSIRIGIQQIVVSSQSWFLASLACRLTIHSSRPPSASAEFVALAVLSITPATPRSEPSVPCGAISRPFMSLPTSRASRRSPLHGLNSHAQPCPCHRLHCSAWLG